MDGTAITDEFAGCSLEDVALAVGYSEPGSEDHALALDALRRRLPVGPGHNMPPLAEVLDEELAPYRKRRDELVRVAQTAAITDDDSAAKTLDLMQLCKLFEDEIDARRKQLVEPHRLAEKAINDRHNRLRLDVQVARQGMNGSGGLRGLLTAWDDRKRADAEQARLKAEREAAAKKIAADSAREQIEKATAAGRGVVSAELNALRLQDEAEHARVEAEAIQAPPTRGQLGPISRKREIGFDVVDSLVFATWLLQQPGLAGNLLQALRTIAGTHLRSLGVEAVARGVDIPGVVARIETGSAHVRR
jgi:hypothetical protein